MNEIPRGNKNTQTYYAVKNEDLSKAYIHLMEKFEIMDVMEELEKP